MLDLGRYLLGVAEIGLLIGFALMGAFSLRERLVPELSGAPAHLTTLVLALALLIWVAELLGTIGLFEPLPYLLTVGACGVASRTLLPRVARVEGGRERTLGPPAGPPRTVPGPAGRNLHVATLISLAIAAIAVAHFADGVRLRLDTGMTGFDSTWYHGPFAAGFFQTGSTWDLHFIAPQFLAWFYPANAEIFHAVGMGAFDRDILSPLLNLGWFIGCLFACWCIGRPYGVAPWSLALGAIALSVPTLSDQAGEARNDVVGAFFLLAAVAIALNAYGERGLPRGALFTACLAAGLAAGTKLNFLIPCAVLVAALAAAAPRGARGRSLGVGTLGAVAGGGYWYLRNLIHTGNPLPWFDQLGPLSLPAPDQELGGREQHSVLGYLTDGSVWSDWFLPGLHDGLGLLWPLLLAAALGGLILCLIPLRQGLASSSEGRGSGASEPSRSEPMLALAGIVGLAVVLAWLIAPTSASGPDGMPHGFESGLRYLAPALVLGLALLPAAPPLRDRLRRLLRGDENSLGRHMNTERSARRGSPGKARPGVAPALAALALLVAVAIGYPIQRDYLRDRYANPSFAAPGLNAAFGWAKSISGARIGTTGTRQYPLFGTDLSNRVEFVGEDRDRGGFVAPGDCRAWRLLLNEGGYDYVVASRDRLEAGKPPYPPTAAWTEGPGARVVLRQPPTVVFRLGGPLDPGGCGASNLRANGSKRAS
jgi:hypothetical protein